MVVVVPPLFPGGVVPLLGGRVSQQVRAGVRWLVEMLKLQWDDSNMAWLYPGVIVAIFNIQRVKPGLWIVLRIRGM